MLKAWKVTPSHEEAFIQRYDQLVVWTLHLTGHDQQRTEDLVHDAFIQFTLARPDLNAIQNLEGYLFAIVRNLHLSQFRRDARRPVKSLSLIDYDSAEAGLRHVDASHLTQIRDELRTICQYACLRKESSKVGSILILRFFHGYYPTEIARILNGPRRAVDDWLRIARSETKIYLNNPQQLGLAKGKLPSSLSDFRFPSESLDFLAELREALFAAKSGACLSESYLQKIYSGEQREQIDRASLSHLVCCKSCLEAANRFLDLPPISGRFPTDTLSPDNGWKTSTGLSPNRRKLLFSRYQSGVRDTYEHIPQELHLAVNGFMVGSQRVSSDWNEQNLSVNISEKIGFIEIFSEQGVRMLLSGIDPPPEGAVTQTARVELSEQRTLQFELSFQETWPNLQTIYHDPQLKSDFVTECAEMSADLMASDMEPMPVPTKPAASPSFLVASLAPASFFSTLRRLFNPLLVTAALAILLVGVIAYLRFPTTPLTAAELLRQARTSAQTTPLLPNHVFRRIIQYEEVHPDSRTIAAKRRIEIWSAPETGVAARRVFDEAGQLIEGEWLAADQTVRAYQRSASPFMTLEADNLKLPVAEDAFTTLRTGWISPAPIQTFEEHVNAGSSQSVEEKSGFYSIHYLAAVQFTEKFDDQPVQATLKIRKSDLRPVEQVFQVLRAGERTEYRFVESSFEKHESQTISPAVFQPDAWIKTLSIKRVANEFNKKNEPVVETLPASNTATPLSAATIAKLKVEALYRLHRLGACLSEPIGLSEIDGGLQIRIITETDSRKQEILNALQNLASTAGVRIDALTESEALQQQASQPSRPFSTRRVELIKYNIPAFAEVRDYFAHRGQGRQTSLSEAALDTEVRRFATQILNRARRALQHAWAIKHALAEFSEAEMQLLDSGSQGQLRSFIRDHARIIQEESVALRRELQPIFFGAGSAESAPTVIPANLMLAADQIFDLAVKNEKNLRLAFTVSEEPGSTSIIRSNEFQISIKAAETLAAGLL